jgi:hypothetical protein
MARFQSGRPDLNRGPHRPELWAKFPVAVRSTCKSMGSSLGSPPLRSSDIAADSRGFGREIDSLPNDEDTDAGSLVISPACSAAAARAALQVPNRRVTTLAAGHSPSARRATASPHVDARGYATSRRRWATSHSAIALNHRREHALGGPTAGWATALAARRSPGSSVIVRQRRVRSARTRGRRARPQACRVRARPRRRHEGGSTCQHR